MAMVGEGLGVVEPAMAGGGGWDVEGNSILSVLKCNFIMCLKCNKKKLIMGVY